MKRLLNRSEEATNSVLRPLTEEWGAHTFPKVRLADVLPIENSGIGNQSFRFALQSHFDFVVTDDDLQILFAVEFDGPTHREDFQLHRDQLKNELCDRFEIPLLRINSRYIGETYRQMDLLTWFVNYWFAQRAIDNAFESRELPPDADVDPMLMMNLPGSKKKFPLWLTADVRISFHKYRDRGLCIDPGPSSFVGLDERGNYRAISYMAVTESFGLIAETGMRSQRFEVPCSELIEAIAEHQIFDDFNSYIDNGIPCVAVDEVATRVRWYYQNCELVMSSVGTQCKMLRDAM